MDVFATVVAIVLAGIALFVGYKVGVKDGFRGGLNTGRQIERHHAEEERRYLSARLVNAQAELAAQSLQRALPPASEPEDAPFDATWQDHPDAETFEPFAERPAPMQGEYLEDV